jgi:hypothetical protein
MRCTAEHIARRSNKEDKCTGRFWEGRFKAQLLLDEASILACAAYVDLNPIRAAIAKIPETSEFTGAKDRIDDLKQRKSNSNETHDWEPSRRRKQSGWLSPVQIDEKRDPIGTDVCPSKRRASRKGFLPISLSQYLSLLDWTGRAVRTGKSGSIPRELKPILIRLGIEPTKWCKLVENFGKLFKRAAGTAPSLATEATRRGQHYLHAPGVRLLTAT